MNGLASTPIDPPALALKRSFAEADWPWTLPALRQDGCLWDALNFTDLGAVALNDLPPEPRLWTPAALGLLAVEAPHTPQELAALPMAPLDEDLRRRVDAAWEDRGAPPGSISLERAVLMALGLRERYIENSTWRGMLAEVSFERPETPTVLACLHGMIPEAERLLGVLLSTRPASALHIFLCRPLPEAEQVRLLSDLFAGLDAAAYVLALQMLSTLRPSLAVRLAEAFAAAQVSNGLEGLDGASDLSAAFDALAAAVRRAHAFQIARRYERAVPILAESLRALRRLRGHLSAGLAQTVGLANDDDQNWNDTARETSLEAWKQAVQLAPDTPRYVAGLVNALRWAGRKEEARQLIGHHQQDVEHEAAVALAAAELAHAEGDLTEATRCSQTALRLAYGSVLDETDWITLFDLFAALELTPQAAEAAEAGLKRYPASVELLQRLAPAQLALGQADRALQTALTAQVFNPPAVEEALPTEALAAAALQVAGYVSIPTAVNLDGVIIAALEALGAWSPALEARLKSVSIEAITNLDELHAVMRCAENAGQGEALEAVCRRILDLSPDDIDARRNLAAAAAARLDTANAVEHYTAAVRLAPEKAALWLALAEVYQSAEEPAQVFETLRLAAQAASDSAEIHTRLGDAYFARSEPTAALACFQRAAVLAPSEAVLERVGQTLLQLGRLEETCSALEPWVQKPMAADGSTDIGYTYARALLGLGRAVEAVPLLTEVVRLRPEPIEPSLDLARALMLVPGQPAGAQAALPFLQRILDLNPGGGEGGYTGRLDASPALRAEARALLAEAYAAVGDTQLAMDAFRSALDDPYNRRPAVQARLSAGLGLTALKLDQADMAVAALQDAVLTEPLNSGLHRSLSEAYLASGLVQDSFQAAGSALELQPEDPGVLHWFIDQVERLADRPAAAQLPIRAHLLVALEAITEIEPQRSDLLLRLGRARLEAGDRPGALDAFRRMAGSEESIPAEQVVEAVRSVRELGDARLSVLILERALGGQDAETKPVQRIALLSELSLSHQEVGDLDAALKAAEDSLDLNPDDARLHVRVAELYTRGERLDDALESMHAAVELSPHDPDLRQRTADLLQRRGRLAEALEMSERGIKALPEGTESADSGVRRSLHLTAAVLAQATLRPRRALEYMNAFTSIDKSAAESYPVAALQAEIALDLGEVELASQAVEIIQRLDGKSPRTNAARSRLARLRKDPDNCVRCCRDALRGLIQKAEQNVVITPSTREEYIASFLSTSQAAIENRMWNEARKTLNRLVEIIPETPLAYFKLAQIDILRGEAECLHRDLEVVRHAYGSEVLSDTAMRGCEANLAQAQALLGVDLKLEASEDFKKWDDECRRTLGAWMARTRALFQPDRRAARVLETMLRLTDAGPQEAAALILAYRRAGDASMALSAAQVAWQPAFDGEQTAYNPLVLTQLALADPDPAGALERAREAVECALGSSEQWPPMAMLEFLLARLAYAQGAFPTAIQAIQRALAAWSDEPNWQSFAGRLYQTSSAADGLPDPVKALVHLEQAAVLEPDLVENHLAIGRIYLGGAQPARALPALERAAALAPQRADIQLAMAKAQLAAGDLSAADQSAERAAAAYSTEPEALAIDGDDIPVSENRAELQAALLLRGRIALQTKRPREAYNHAQTMLRVDPNHPEALYLLARSLEALDRPAEALTILDKALEAQNSPLPMLLERIRLVHRSQGLEAGLAAVQEQVERTPGQAELLALQAEWLIAAGKVDAGVAAARQALLQESGSLDQAERARMYLLIGLQMRRAGQLDQAIINLSEAVNHAPDDLEGYLELGRAYQERREYRQALKVYQKAITVAGSDYRPYYQAGLVLKDSKDYIAAEAMLRRAAQVAPNEVSIHRLLGAVVALNLVHNRRISSPEG